MHVAVGRRGDAALRQRVGGGGVKRVPARKSARGRGRGEEGKGVGEREKVHTRPSISERGITHHIIAKKFKAIWGGDKGDSRARGARDLGFLDGGVPMDIQPRAVC